MKKIFSFILLGILVFSSVFFVFEKPVGAEWAGHLVISEVQITGGTGQTTNDFIELYNPTTSVVDLSGWKLRKKIQSGSESSIRVFPDGKTISAHGYFLWASSKDNFHLVVNADEWSDATLTNNNSIGLFNVSDVLIDALAWGSGHTNPFIEGSTTSTPANPGTNQSLQRKPGGSGGNGEDTNDNYNDFLSPDTSSPQNTQSPVVPPISGPICGNTICETGENSTTCPQDCSVQQNPVCGNNVKESGEDCDGADLNQKTCVILGWSGGTLNCSASCAFNTSGCTSGGGGINPGPPSYNSSDIVINEFVSDPVDDGKEWIELYNNTSQEIDLESWKLEDGTETETKLSGKIATKNFAVIENLKFYLNNKGDIIILKDPSGAIIDSVTYGDWKDNNVADNALAPNDPASASRIKDGQDTNNDLNDFKLTSPTKGTNNFVGEEIENKTNADIYFNEIIPNPVGDDSAGEFIELKNFGTQDIDLNDWKIQDASESKYIISKNDFSATVILAGKFFVLPRSITKIALNNSGEESLKIYNANNQLVDSLNYEGSTPEGESYARTSDQKWQWTKNITSNQENIFSNDEDEENLDQTAELKISKTSTEKNESEILKISLAEIREQEIGVEVNVQGVVSVGPGVLGTQIFYLAGSGIQIYFYKKDFPSLKIGDLVEITGELAEYKGENRIKISQKEDIKVIKHQNLPSAKEIKIGDIGEDLEGSLVIITGEMIEARSNYFYLDDGTDEIKVYLKSAAKIKKPKFKEGDLVKVTGIVSQNDDEYRILPRFQDDMKIIENEIKAETEQEESTKEITGALSAINENSSISNIFQWFNNLGVAKYFILSTVALIIILVGLLIKKKKK